MKDNVKAWRSTIIGLLTLIISILLVLDVISSDESEILSGHIGVIAEAIISLVLVIGGIINIFKSKL